MDEDEEEFIKERYNSIKDKFPSIFARQLQEFITSDEINGSDIKLVIKKRVHARPTQNWFNMPFKHLETHDFLMPEEKEVLGNGSEIEVALVGPKLKMYKKPMSLKIGGNWNNKNYVLKNNWSDFVEANKNVLEEGTIIQVWSFRKDKQLCFAVVCVD
ncbi:B3 domain-containing protein, DNA-binding pseudobarrel domain protein [Tanacetum coccineum]